VGPKIGLASKSQDRLAQAEAPAQNFLEHFSFQGTDGMVDLGQLVVGAGVLLEHRLAPVTSPGDLGLDPPVMQDRAELDHPPFPLLAIDLCAIEVGQPVDDPGEQEASQLTILDRPHHLIPEHHRQVGIILTEPLERLGTGLIREFGPAAPPGEALALDQPRPDQPRQPVADRGGRDPQLTSHLGDIERPFPADQVQEATVR